MSGPDKARTFDYALGSTLECAACLDIASIKGRLSQERSFTEKRRLLEITRMLIGLRKAWLQKVMSEESGPYQAEPSTPGFEVLFHHESLDVYQVGLDFMRWFVSLPGGRELSDRLCREVDTHQTAGWNTVCQEPLCPGARRERGSVSRAILDRTSNEAPGHNGLGPQGCGAFGLWLRCSSGHRALRLCSPPRASPQAKIACNKLCSILRSGEYVATQHVTEK